MAKTFRIKALFISLCIILSLFSGMGAMASEDILVSWDADLDFITITLSEEINVSLLEESVSLKQDGEDVAVTVDFINHEDVKRLNNSYHMATESTYAITPVGGMEEDVIYNLAIDGSIFGNDSEDFVKMFKVEKLDEGMEYKYKAEVGKWSYLNGNISNIDGEMRYDGSTNKLVAPIKTTTGTPAGRYIRHCYSTAPSQATTTKNYTVKMKYANTGAPTETQYRLYSHMVDHTKNFMFVYGVNSAGNHTVRLYENESTTLAGGQGMHVAFFDELLLGDEIELKISVRDGYINAYLNNVKVADAKFTAEHYGYPGFNVRTANANGGLDILMSDYAMTQVVEYYSATIDKTENVELADSVNITLPKAAKEGFNPESYAILTKDGEEVEGYTAVLSDDGTYVTVSFEGLSYKTKYDIEFPAYEYADGSKGPIVPVSFTTLPPEYDLESFILFDANLEEVGSMDELTTDKFSVAARVVNNRLEDAKTATITVAIYNDLGQMCAAIGDVYTLEKGDYADVVIENFERVPGRTYIAKCFVWDSFVGMKTIFESCIE